MAQLPSTIGRYLIQSRLGGGGMGEVFLGRDESLDRLVAIKLLKEGIDSDEIRQRFEREARTIARLAHPNIVRIYELGESEGMPFIAMEYVAGETLGELIKRRPQLPLERKLRHIEELCTGLAAAHRAGIVHRDIKPANIIVGNDDVLKILDFGIARIAGSGMTRQGMLIGTVNYMSPEQVLGQPVDQRSDVFAVAAVFYELLGYRQAFPGGLPDVLFAISQAAPAPLLTLCPDLPAAIGPIVDQGLEKDPNKRYQDLDAMRRDVARLRERIEKEVDGDAVQNQVTVRLDRGAPTGGARRLTDPERLAQRRREQVDNHLTAARQAYANERFDEAIDLAELAAAIDGDDLRPGRLIEQCRIALDERRVQQWLAEAASFVEQGALTEAQRLAMQCLDVLPDSQEVAAFTRDLQRKLDEQQRAQQRAEQVRSALDRARTRREQGAFDSALRSADEALAFDPAHPEALALRQTLVAAVEEARRREADEAAADAASRAKALFDRGQHAEAIALLQRWRPRHEIVEAALRQLQDELTAIRQREAQEREKGERREKATALLAEAKRAIGERDFNAAGGLARQAEELAPDLEELASVLAASDEGKRRAQAIAARLTDARALRDRGDLAGALGRLQEALQLDPVDPQLAPLVEEAAAALREHEALKRAELERRATAVVAAATRHFADGRCEEAIAMLEGFSPAHEIVQRGLGELQAQWTAIVKKRQAEQRAARNAALKKAQASLDGEDFADATSTLEQLLAAQPDCEEAAVLLARTREASHAFRQRQERTARAVAEARTRIARRELDPANALLDEIVRLAPKHPDVAPLREAIERERAAVVAERERAEQIARALAEGRSLLAQQQLDAANASIDDVLRLEPKHKEALQLRKAIARAQSKVRAMPEAVAPVEVGVETPVVRPGRPAEPSVARPGGFAPALRTLPRAAVLSGAAGLVLVVVLVAILMVRESPQVGLPTEVGAPTGNPPAPTAAELVQEAARRYDNGETAEAIRGVRAALARNPGDAAALGLLGRMRDEATADSKAAREAATRAGATQAAEFNAGVQNEAKAATAADAEAAIGLLREAERSFRAAESSAWNPAQFLERARQEQRNGRLDQAILTAQSGLRDSPRDTGLLGFLSATRRRAADRTATARVAALKEGADQRASATFKQAQQREQEARRLTEAEQTDEAVTTLAAAEELYRQSLTEAAAAAKRARLTAEQTTLEIRTRLNRAQELVRTGDADQARRELEAANLLGIEKSGDAALATQATRLEEQIDRLTRERERDQRVADLIKRASAASNADAIGLLEQARTEDPSRRDIQDLLQTRRQALERERADRAPNPTAGATAAPTAPTPSPPTPTQRPAQPAPVSPEDEAIRATLQSYASAFGRKDLAVLDRTFPANSRAFRSEFDLANSIEVEIRVESIQIQGDTARVACEFNRHYNWKRSGLPPVTKDRSVLTMRKVNGTWRIEAAGR